VSGNELAAVESLLTSVLADPSEFGRRLMEQVMDRLAMAPASSTTRPPVTVPGSLADEPDEEVLDRQILLAAALGACECWGSDPGCHFCGGDGLPGWRPPDPQLYEEFVTPATSRLAEAMNHTTETTEGSSDEHEMAGSQ
jgi:hypothetical protein